MNPIRSSLLFMNPYLCKRKAFPSHKQHPLPSFDPRDAQHPLDGQLGTEMRVLITTPEMAIRLSLCQTRTPPLPPPLTSDRWDLLSIREARTQIGTSVYLVLIIPITLSSRSTTRSTSSSAQVRESTSAPHRAYQLTDPAKMLHPQRYRSLWKVAAPITP